MPESEGDRKTQTTRGGDNRALRKILEIVGIYIVFWILIFLTTYRTRSIRDPQEQLYLPLVSFFAFVLLVFIEAIISVIQGINRKKTLNNSEKTLKTVLEVSAIYVVSWFLTTCVFWTIGDLTLYYWPTELMFWQMAFWSFVLTVALVTILNAYRMNCDKNANGRAKANKKSAHD